MENNETLDLSGVPCPQNGVRVLKLETMERY